MEVPVDQPPVRGKVKVGVAARDLEVDRVLAEVPVDRSQARGKAGVEVQDLVVDLGLVAPVVPALERGRTAKGKRVIAPAAAVLVP